MADEGRGYADEGEEMFCLALVAAVEPAAADEPGHGPFDNPPVASQPLRGLDAAAGGAVPDAAPAEPSARVVVVVALVGVKLAGLPSTGSSSRSDRGNPAYARLEALTVVHVGAGDSQDSGSPFRSVIR